MATQLLLKQSTETNKVSALKICVQIHVLDVCRVDMVQCMLIPILHYI